MLLTTRLCWFPPPPWYKATLFRGVIGGGVLLFIYTDSLGKLLSTENACFCVKKACIWAEKARVCAEEACICAEKARFSTEKRCPVRVTVRFSTEKLRPLTEKSRVSTEKLRICEKWDFHEITTRFYGETVCFHGEGVAPMGHRILELKYIFPVWK